MKVKSKLGKRFLNLVCACFPKGHVLNKIYNRNTVKISYSCMPNMKAHIDVHNKRLLNKTKDQNDNPPKACNCRRKEECPLEGKCQSKGIIYQATVHSDNITKSYIGSTETSFKQRYANHLYSFRHEKMRSATELSKYIWQLKSSNINFNIKWKLIQFSKPYSNLNKRCNLCCLEKYYIIFKPQMAQLNRRLELFSSCRHMSRFLLDNLA